MTQQELLEILDSWENLNVVIKETGNHPTHFDLLMEIALNSQEKNSWRAAWMADKIHDNYPNLIKPYLGKMVERLNNSLQVGKKRHFLKLISLNDIPEEYHGFLVNYCLTALTSAKEPPAVRVHAMQVLFNISEKEPELKPELLAVIEHEMEYHATAGILSRGKKLARKLHKQIRQNVNEAMGPLLKKDG